MDIFLHPLHHPRGTNIACTTCKSLNTSVAQRYGWPPMSHLFHKTCFLTVRVWRLASSSNSVVKSRVEKLPLRACCFAWVLYGLRSLGLRECLREWAWTQPSHMGAQVPAEILADPQGSVWDCLSIALQKHSLLTLQSSTTNSGPCAEHREG